MSTSISQLISITIIFIISALSTSCMPFTKIGTPEPTQEEIEAQMAKDQAAIDQAAEALRRAMRIVYDSSFGAWYPMSANNYLTKKHDPFKQRSLFRSKTYRHRDSEGRYAVDISVIKITNELNSVDGLDVIFYANTSRYYNPNEIIILGFRQNESHVISYEPTHSRLSSSSKANFRILNPRSLADAESDTLKGRIYTDAFYADFDFPRSIITEFYEQMEAGAWTLID